MPTKKIAILIGGSDLILGMRGLSAGTRIIVKSIDQHFDEVIAINYNYFLDFNTTLKKTEKIIASQDENTKIFLYGYSKGGDVVLKLSRLLVNKREIELLITVDVANGPWSHKINRHVPANVKHNINVFQSTPSPPLRSYGLATFSDAGVVIQNIDLTNEIIASQKVNHRMIERLVADDIISWLISFSRTI